MNGHKGYGVPADDLDYMVNAAREDLLRLKGARIFLTGCTGFIGKWIIEGLLYGNEVLGLGLELIALTRSNAKVLREMPHWATHKNLNIFQGDIINNSFIHLRGITHIIHGANYVNDGSENWALRHIETAIYGTKNILDLARINRCNKLILLSSGAIYNNNVINSFKYKEHERCELDYLQERNIYGLCKYFEEVYCVSYCKKNNINIEIARLFTFTGNTLEKNIHKALTSFIKCALDHKDFIINGDGQSIRTYMHCSDMFIWILKLISNDKFNGPYNIGSDECISIFDLAKKIKEISKSYNKIIILNNEDKGNAPKLYVPDVSKIIDKYNLSYRYNIQNQIEKIIETNKNTA